jgi:hypothetical protein
MLFLKLVPFVLSGSVVDRRITTTVTRPLPLPFVQHPLPAYLTLPRSKRVTLFASAQDKNDDTTEPTDDQETQPPPYIEQESAIDVFSDMFFYPDQLVLDASKPRREAALKNMSVGEVYQTYVMENLGGKEQGLKDFADMIWARINAVEAFFYPSDEPVERILARMELVALTATNDLTKFDVDAVKNLPITKSLWEEACNKVNSMGVSSRAFPLCLVLGPSGSGKTFFALEYARNSFFVPPGMDAVTLYLRPGKLGIQFNSSNPFAANELIDRIRQECAEKSKRKISGQLKMHICLIMDEAGSSDTKQWFESKAMLDKLCTEANDLASSVLVFVVGTGLTGRELSSTDDAYIFRMRPWQASDLSRVLDAQILNLRLAKQETVDTVAHAIFAHPILRALASNGRSASFLVRKVGKLSSTYPRVSWDWQLQEWTQTLVTEVVDGYASLNGIKGLTTNQRRRVAASVFRALQKTKEGDTSLPTFEELEGLEIPVAESLIQYNLERRVDKLEIVIGERFAFTLTPAIVVVLYSMAGVYTSVMPGWKSEEEIAALYAVRQSVIQIMERFVSDLSTGLNRFDCQDELDKSLERVRLVRFQGKLQSNSTNVTVPMVDGETIMMNGDKASFADVIAPYTLIQAKNTINPSKTYSVELYEEVKKCGLVMGEDCDTRLLRGLIAVWENKIGSNGIKTKSTTESSSFPNDGRRNLQYSKAFPENVLSLVPSKDPIQYAVIEGKNATTITIDNGETRIPLPALGHHNITFILSTNAERLRLNLGPPIPPLTITEANVDDDMEINVETLDDSGKSAWTTFVNIRMRKKVQIKFLFTT